MKFPHLSLFRFSNPPLISEDFLSTLPPLSPSPIKERGRNFGRGGFAPLGLPLANLEASPLLNAPVLTGVLFKRYRSESADVHALAAGNTPFFYVGFHIIKIQYADGTYRHTCFTTNAFVFINLDSHI
jgi:hypothetical protein